MTATTQPANHDHAPAHLRAHADVWLSGVTAGYADIPAIENVSLAVESGTLLAVVGPNGAGKSTLLKVIAGLLMPWTGRVDVLGGAPGREAHRVAYVPQAEAVDWAFPVTVGDVVMMGRYPLLGPLRRPGVVDRRHVDEALEKVHMADHRQTQIGRLSGGQRRRVFLARALAADPALYLLDEPVTGIDATTQEDLMDILEGESRRGRTVIATTHDLACAAQRFQRVAAINHRVIADGPASLLLDPEVLSRTYGGHLLVLGGQTVVIDDAHHHDQPGEGEVHYHDEARREG
jgi:ABC-type Mn2+/Zn2+ transport system ATPase subunit